MQKRRVEKEQKWQEMTQPQQQADTDSESHRYDAASIRNMPEPEMPPCELGRSHSWVLKKRGMDAPSFDFVYEYQQCAICHKIRIVSHDRDAGRLYWYNDGDGKRIKSPSGYPPYPVWRNIGTKKGDNP